MPRVASEGVKRDVEGHYQILTLFLAYLLAYSYFCGMKRYILFILPFLLALCLTAGCGGRGEVHRRLAAVDSIVDSHYDSALVVLRGMDSLPMRRSDRMYMELLRAKAMNKASVPFTTDSVMRRVARYYDRHGSRNQRLLAHYLLGCTYRDLGSAPRALEEYQRAVSQADTARADCDLPTLMRVHSQMSNLYMMMRLSEHALKEDSIASQICQRMGDVQSALSFKQDACAVLYQEGKYEECIQAAQALYDEYVSHGLKDNVALVYIHAVRSCIALKDFETAKHYLDNYEQSAHIRGDRRNISGGLAPYYICRGNCFLGLGMSDSAEVYFRKAFKDMHIRQNESAVYDGLSRAYSLMGLPDSVYKYSRLSNDELLKKYNIANADATIRVRSVYDYHIEQMIAESARAKTKRWRSWVLFLAFVSVSLFALVLLIRYKNERRKHQITTLELQLEVNRTDMLKAQETLAALQQEKDNIEKKMTESSELAASLQQEKNRKDEEIQGLQDNIAEKEEECAHALRKLQILQDSIPPSTLMSEPIVKRIKETLNNPVQLHIAEKEWEELVITVERQIPTFKCTMNRYGNLSETEYRVCLLTIIGISNSGINIMMNKSGSFSTVTEKRLNKKVFHGKESASDFRRQLYKML